VRTVLVVMQFAVSIGLGTAVLVVFAQISFARDIKLGLDKAGMVVLRANAMTFNARQSMTRALAADTTLKGAALSSDVPFSGNTNNGVYRLPGMPGSMVMRTLSVGPDFFSLYGIRLLNGRDFSWGDMGIKHRPLNILINEAAAKKFGITPENAIGKRLFALEGIQSPQQWDEATIVGVSSDFMFDGDRRQVAPTVYVFDPDSLSRVSVKVPAEAVPQALTAIDRIWRAFAPSVAINRHFLDADFERQFQSDERQETIFRIFVIIAILIACLGLFGLAAFSTVRRTKEIGIRKAFGAKTANIVLMLLWQFSLPVLAANLIAWPVAYYYLHHWLEGYAYRISLNPLYFLGAGLAAMIIAWVTVLVHARRVANANPIHALRYE
jgi:putative ABC transport system permease protein